MKQSDVRNNALSDWVSSTREAKGLTGNALAELAKVDPANVSRLQRGIVPGRGVLLKILQMLTDDQSVLNGWLTQTGYSPEPDYCPLPSQEGLSVQTTVGETTGNSLSLRRALRQMNRRFAREREDMIRIEEQLLDVVPFLEMHWANKPDIPYIPKHGLEYNIRLIEILCREFQDALDALSSVEVRALFLGALLHDIGLGLRPPEIPAVNNDERLEKYEIFSVQFLTQHADELGLSQREIREVANLCLYHRNTKALEDIGIDRRQLAMIALLRLAGLMNIEPERVQPRATLTLKKVPRDIASEVLRNVFLARIRKDDDQCLLEAAVVRGSGWGPVKLGLLVSRIKHDLQAALDRIKSVLIVDLQTRLFFCDAQAVPLPRGRDKEALEAVLEALGTSSSPNAARVFKSLYASLLALLDPKAPPADRFEQVRNEINYYQQLRSYHVQIRNLAQELSRALESSPSEQRIQFARKIVEDYEATRARAYAEMAKAAKELFTKPTRFVLFGYSSCVAQLLAHLPETIASHSVVYVCECRNKTLYYDFGDAVEYCDGMEYARVISHPDKRRYNRIQVISDASVSYYLQPGLYFETEANMETVVLLGADGIAPNGDVSGTIGSMTVVAAASSFNAKVYILAEGKKVGDIDWGAGIRENGWLTGDDRTIAALEKDGVSVGNPLNEKVNSDRITAYVTEKGILTPEQFRDHYGLHGN